MRCVRARRTLWIDRVVAELLDRATVEQIRMMLPYICYLDALVHRAFSRLRSAQVLSEADSLMLASRVVTGLGWERRVDSYHRTIALVEWDIQEALCRPCRFADVFPLTESIAEFMLALVKANRTDVLAALDMIHFRQGWEGRMTRVTLPSDHGLGREPITSYNLDFRSTTRLIETIGRHGDDTTAQFFGPLLTATPQAWEDFTGAITLGDNLRLLPYCIVGDDDDDVHPSSMPTHADALARLMRMTPLQSEQQAQDEGGHNFRSDITGMPPLNILRFLGGGQETLSVAPSNDSTFGFEYSLLFPSGLTLVFDGDLSLATTFYYRTRQVRNRLERESGAITHTFLVSQAGEAFEMARRLASSHEVYLETEEEILAEHLPLLTSVCDHLSWVAEPFFTWGTLFTCMPAFALCPNTTAAIVLARLALDVRRGRARQREPLPIRSFLFYIQAMMPPNVDRILHALRDATLHPNDAVALTVTPADSYPMYKPACVPLANMATEMRKKIALAVAVAAPVWGKCEPVQSTTLRA